MDSCMKKVLIISGNFFGYQDSVRRAFEGLNYDVRVELFDGPVHPFKGWNKWKHKLSWNKERVRHESRLKYAEYIKSVYDEYLPDIVFTFNGTILLDGTLDYFRIKSKVVLWMYDSVQRPEYKICHDHIDHVDAFFCFDKKDVDYFASIGKTAYFLPLACDPSVYHPLPLVKDIDIFFVGAIYNSPKRIRILEHIVDHYPNKKILIYGKYKPIEKNPIVWLFRSHRDTFMNENISPEVVNQMYSRAKVALNIHNEQSIYSANQRFFEACGAGSYQICDVNQFTKSFFKQPCIGLYDSEKELYELIDWALRPENQEKREEKARVAMEIILSENTFMNRTIEILKTIGEY